jgi:uncharacterized protein (DUF927 family)
MRGWLSGLTIVQNKHLHLVSYISGVDISRRVRTVDRTGWHNGVFVLPEDVIGANGDDPVMLISPGEHGYAHAGTLEDWKENVAKRAEPHSLMRLSISTALSGSLLALIDAESGGVHLTGDSSTGKTTGARLAASTWGKGDTKEGFLKKWHSTANALEGTAAAVSDTVLTLDELGEANAADVAGIVYMLGNEGGKGRMRADTTIRQVRSWRLAVLSTGEKTLAQKVAEHFGKKASAGIEMRIVNVDADAGQGFGAFDSLDGYDDGAALANAMKKASMKYYGVAGPAFVRAIIEHGYEETAAKARKMIAAFVDKHVAKDATGQVRRVAQRFGVIATAAELAIEFGVLPWAKGSADKAAAWALARWIVSNGGDKTVIEDRQALEHVRHLMEKYGEANFVDATPTVPPRPTFKPAEGEDVDAGSYEEEETFCKKGERVVLQRWGFRRDNGLGGARRWLVSKEVWKTEFCAGRDPVKVAKLLAAKGMLQRNGKNLTNYMDVDGVRQPGYLLNKSILESDAGDGEEDG